MDKKRILVVDDDDRWLQTIEEILGDEYELKLTKEPSDAISLMKSCYFALAILDQRISVDVSGVDLLRQLRRIQYDLRVIILTGYAAIEDAVDSMEGGAYYYLSKGRSDLPNVLRTRLEKAFTENLDEELITALIAKG